MRAWGASGRWFKSSRPDSEAPDFTRESGGPGASLFQAPEHLTTGSPSRAAEESATDLIRTALAALGGGVVRLGDLRALLQRALASLEAGGKEHGEMPSGGQGQTTTAPVTEDVPGPWCPSAEVGRIWTRPTRQRP